MSRHIKWRHADSGFIDDYENSPNVFYREVVTEQSFTEQNDIPKRQKFHDKIITKKCYHTHTL